MGIGDFLTGIDDSIDSLIGKVSPGYQAWLDQDKAKLAAANGNTAALGDANSNDMGALFSGLGDIPGFDQLMTVLDAPRRGIDTALITARHSEAAGQRTHTSQWAEMFNKNSWTRAWDMASMQNADRVTGGAIVTTAFGTGVDFDPFAGVEAKKLQDEANATWYGRTLTTTVDLGESMVSLPGTGVLARSRAAAGITTVADAERVAQKFNEVGATSRTIGQKAKDTLNLSVPSGAQNVDALVARQVEGLRAFDGNLDEYQTFEQLKSRMETAPDGEVRKLANVFTQINKVADPLVRDRLRMNTFLAGLGSATAKRALIEEAPLLAKNFENLTTTPREFGALTDLYAMRLDGEDLPINDVVESTWNTASDRAELAAMKDEIRTRKTAVSEHNRLISELKQLRPKVHDTPEARHIKGRREEKHSEVQKLEDELRTAKQDLHGAKRWAGGAAKKAKGVGATDDVVDFNQAIGDARRRVEDTHARLMQARSDRDLLDSTPLHDPTMLDDWRSMVDEARLERSGLAESLDAAKAERAELKDTLRMKEQEIARVRPFLARNNAIINDILDIASKDSDLALVGDAKPTLLNRAKTSLRETIGAEHYVTAGDGNTIVRLRSLPGRSAKMALAPQARGSIALNEIGLGARQLSDTMARSKAFTPEEIAAVRNDLIRTPAGDAHGVVARVQDAMLERMATNFFRERMPELTPEQAVAHAKELTALTTKAWGKGNDWVAKASDEQLVDDMVIIRDLEGEAVAYDGPMLRSQLADAAPMFDPWDFERMLKEHEATLVGNVRKFGLSPVVHAHDFVVSAWKLGALLRPGLMVRSMLDTGPRALASISAADSLIAAMNGAANMVNNRALKGLAKVHFGGLTPDKAAAKARFLGLKPVKVDGKYEFRFAEDALDLQSKLAAASKGETVHGALFHDQAKLYDSIQLDRASWKRRAADSTLWHVAYKEYAGMLLASPTARKLAEMSTHVDDAVDVRGVLKSIKDSPEFTAEYRKLAQPMGRTRSEFLQQLVHEVDLMFPNERVLKAAKDGGLNKKMLEREFPAGQRFDVPAPDMSALEAADKMRGAKKAVDAAFRTLLDKPDMWLARNPVAVQLYNRGVKNEIDAMKRQFGGDYELSAKDIKLIDSRARGAAIGHVRKTFFDTTRNTGLHRSVARFSPFIAAWEDAMISWGRLIYDDPRRLTKLAAAYHSPYTISTSQNLNLVVDQDGQPIGRGSDADQVNVLVPLGALGKAVGVPAYRVRLDAINSIAQGETWWLPGVGPSVALGATYALGSGKVMSRDAALDLVDTDSAMGKAILKSVFLGGEVPPADAGSMVQQLTPGWMRTLTTQAFGTGKIRNRQTTFNYLVSDALANGQTLRDSDYAKLWERADKSANAAAVVRLAMSAGLGMTGSASVDGQFYADQMHIIESMPEAERNGLTADEFFAQQYPEAADLDWSITKNETGIQAKVEASKAETRLNPVLKQNPKDIGWMIVGAANMVDSEFSRTAYGFQRADGNRTFQSQQDAQQEAQAAVGWRQLNAWSTQISDQMVANGANPETVETTPQFRAAKKAIRAYLVQTNSAFAEDSTSFSNSFDAYYAHALRLSSDGPLKARSDMVTFRDYDAARTEIMRQFDIKSFDGTSPQYGQARAVLAQVGTTLGQRDLGFQQMWDRFLEREAE